MRGPLQNRVTPTGQIIADPARGSLMGNRGGMLHDSAQRLGHARWRSPRWIICVLNFKGRHRQVMAPNSYTELFFHDEPVALAAGHRPCAECQRARYLAFRDAFARASGCFSPASQIDRALHQARLAPGRAQRCHTAPWESLPDGVFVSDASGPCLLWRGQIHAWTPNGYATQGPVPTRGLATVLTPAPTVACLLHGYRPDSPLGLA